eukprot:scaffold56780_cov62-Phaeocystis_antarctica.AAC.5
MLIWHRVEYDLALKRGKCALRGSSQSEYLNGTLKLSSPAVVVLVPSKAHLVSRKRNMTAPILHAMRGGAACLRQRVLPYFVHGRLTYDAVHKQSISSEEQLRKVQLVGSDIVRQAAAANKLACLQAELPYGRAPGKSLNVKDGAVRAGAHDVDVSPCAWQIHVQGARWEAEDAQSTHVVRILA